MKNIVLIAGWLLLNAISSDGQGSYCDSTGNVVIFSNYDGGILNIDVDVNIPNLKIGITSYMATQVNISGAFVGNVTEVIYAGYSSNGDNCALGVTTTSINGVPANITDIRQSPAATYSNVNGYAYIICAYSCDTASNQGGCNAVDQISDYFLTQFGGSLLFHRTGYNCFQPTSPRLISSGGNCCIVPPVAPTANFSFTPGTICEGECINFTDLSTGSPSSWSWSFPGASTTSSNAQNPNGICYPSAGNYTVTLTAGNTQGSNTSTLSVVVASVPAQPVINLNGGILSSTGGSSYQWNLNGNAISGATSSTYTPTSNGTYTVTITGPNGCQSTSANFLFNSLSIEDRSLQNPMLVFPNPAVDLITLKTPSAFTGETGSLMDINGKIVQSFPIYSSNTTIDISAIPNGNYLIVIGSKGKVYSEKITIQH